MTVGKFDLFAGLCTPQPRVDRDHVQEQRHKARLTTARLARDREDCALLLTILGLMPGQEPGSVDHVVPAPFVR